MLVLVCLFEGFHVDVKALGDSLKARHCLELKSILYARCVKSSLYVMHVKLLLGNDYTMQEWQACQLQSATHELHLSTVSVLLICIFLNYAAQD